MAEPKIKQVAKQDNQLPDLSALKTCIGRVEQCQEEMLSIKASYMAQCKQIREEMKDIYAAAKEKGLSSRAIKVLIRNRQRQKDIEKDIAGLGIEISGEYETYATASEAWETTPLAEAASAAA